MAPTGRKLFISETENGPTSYVVSITDTLYTAIGEARRINPADGRTMYGFRQFRTPRLCMNALLRLLMGRRDWAEPSRRPAPRSFLPFPPTP